MRRARSVLGVAVLGVMCLPVVEAAAHCGNDAGPRAHDPFGSCETNAGRVRCGEGSDVAGLFVLSTAESGNGAQVCNADGPVPVWGRAGVWTDGETVTVGVDGSSDTEPSNGWTRLDVTADGCARVRRGDGNGSYYTEGGGTSEPDTDQRFCL